MTKNPLLDVVPVKYRKFVYALLVLLALVYAAYEANDGDWKKTVAALLVSLIGATAHANANVPNKPKAR